MPIVFGIDFETTGLDPKVDQIIEVGAALWDTKLKQVIQCESYPIRHQGIEITEEITRITGITPALLSMGKSPDALAGTLVYYGSQADYIVAHNAEFEKGFIDALYGHLWEGMDYNWFFNATKFWIDTKTDLPGYEGRRLVHLAAELGFVNPFPHRALSDVMTMLKVLSMFDFDEVVRHALAPKETLIITFPYDETRQKNKSVKAMGYHWHDDHKQWRKTVPDFRVEEEMGKARQAGFTPYVALKELTA